jgi:hypothetical protein
MTESSTNAIPNESHWPGRTRNFARPGSIDYLSLNFQN